jgi:ribonuclease VapC
VFADASALTSILVGEEDCEELATRLTAAPSTFTSGIAIWETSLAVARLLEIEISYALSETRDYLEAVQVRVVPIGDEEAAVALDAQLRFGMGRHPAKLNMGDCFSYACARVHGVPLLYKGDDFALTDIERA